MRAVGAGARIECGGRLLDRPGFFYEPTVLSNVEQSSKIVQTEIFGPVITVQRFRDDGEALELANDFERLWLASPVGLVSLADAHGCTEALNDEICAHASFYAVNASRRLDAFILSRALVRALFAIPIRMRSRRASAGSVEISQLLPKQES